MNQGALQKQNQSQTASGIKHATIVIPTYNESKNIGRLLTALIDLRPKVAPVTLAIVVVDDTSPDGTGEIVQRYVDNDPDIHLVTNKMKKGLGFAYIQGFKYIRENLDTDVIFEMDGDFSHSPHDVPRLLSKIQEGYDFVIGSRYIPGGSIPKDWPFFRKINSRWGNIAARLIAGISQVKDCTGGFRAIRAEVIEKINLNNLQVKGYAFQISLLHAAAKHNARFAEVPIHFKDRKEGTSKMSIKDIWEFVEFTFFLRSPQLRNLFVYSVFSLPLLFFGIIILALVLTEVTSVQTLFAITVTVLSILFTIQGIFTLFWMLYAWNNPKTVNEHKSPKNFIDPNLSFSVLIPARHEEDVIADTIEAVASIDYPEEMNEILVVIRNDDTGTIEAAEKAIQVLKQTNVRVVQTQGYPINKPKSLNAGLDEATNDVVVIFDAEDEPHRDILNIANTVMTQKNADVLQSGVQLINFRSSWFSTLNVLEYYFWFKSALHFFVKSGLTPLGGNTVFFKRDWLEKIGGWDEDCLTEDADVGYKMSAQGATIEIVYDAQHTTQEETPPTLGSFIKQRTRWNQGFVQIFMKGEWLKLPTWPQKLFAGYLLLLPEILAFMFIYIPFALMAMLYLKLPIVIAMLSIVPFIISALILLTSIVALHEFTQEYKMEFPFWMPLKVMVTFYPFILLLNLSSTRALFRMIQSNTSWEKTEHVNAHRDADIFTPALADN